MDCWAAYMIRLTREIGDFDLSGFSESALLDMGVVDRLIALKRIYFNLQKHYPQFYAPNLPPAEVARRGYMVNLIQLGKPIQGNETMVQLHEQLKEVNLLEAFRMFDLNGRTEESLQVFETVEQLLAMKNVYRNLRKHYPDLYVLHLTPEEVFRRGLLSEFIRGGQPVRGDETVHEMRCRLKELKHQKDFERKSSAVQSFQEAKHALDEKLAETEELREFLAGIDFEGLE